MFARTMNAVMGCGPRWKRGIWYNVASYSTLQTDSSRCGQQLGDADQIVSSGRQHEQPFDQCPTAMSRLAQAAYRLHPAEGFFDLLSLYGADAMTGIASGPTVDRRAAVGIVLRHVRCATALAAAGDEFGCVVVLVATHRAAGLRIVVDHREADRKL